MADADGGLKGHSIRLPEEAIQAAKIAAGYRGISLMKYLGEIITEVANWDIENAHRDYRARVPAPKEPPRSRRGRKARGGA